MNTLSSPVRRGNRLPKPAAKRLFCLPPAGAGANTYFPWLDIAPKDLDVCPVSLPGREDRLQEPLADSISALADELVLTLNPELDRPYAVIGYSMGALIAYEWLLRNQIFNLPAPELLVVLAARAPGTHKSLATPLHQLDDQDFRQLLLDVGGTPPEILQNDAVMELFEPVLRNDFRISETYQRQPVLPLNCPILALHCLDDNLLQASDVKAWSDCTQQSFHFKTLAQPHVVSRNKFIELLDLITFYWP